MRTTRNATNHGFTLMELLIVLTIIGLLAALAGPALYQRMKNAKHSTAKAQIENFVTALDSYFVDMERYPSAQEGLRALVKAPAASKKWQGPYLKKDIPLDPWGRDYVYRTPGKNGPFDVLTLGADGRPGGEGEDRDLDNWQNDT